MTIIKPTDVYDSKKLKEALSGLGDYVYAYYEPSLEPNAPFYVGRGSGARCLAHWKKALGANGRHESLHIKKIRKILREGKVPHIRFLAYNLDTSKEKRAHLVERVIQEAFGIQTWFQKRLGTDRLTESAMPIGSLLQTRRDSKSRPQLLETALCMFSKTSVLEVEKLAKEDNLPVLVVGISESFQPFYQRDQLVEMARKYWNGKSFKGANDGSFWSSKRAYLLAWRGLDCKGKKKPFVVGAWEINPSKAHEHQGRHEFPATDDFELSKKVIGYALPNTGNHWQGQRVFSPELISDRRSLRKRR